MFINAVEKVERKKKQKWEKIILNSFRICETYFYFKIGEKLGGYTRLSMFEIRVHCNGVCQNSKSRNINIVHCTVSLTLIEQTHSA